GIPQSRLKIAASRGLLASRSTTHIWRKRGDELGSAHILCAVLRILLRALVPSIEKNCRRRSPTQRAECASYPENFSSDLAKFPGKGRTRSKIRSAIGFAVE